VEKPDGENGKGLHLGKSRIACLVKGGETGGKDLWRHPWESVQDARAGGTRSVKTKKERIDSRQERRNSKLVCTGETHIVRNKHGPWIYSREVLLARIQVLGETVQVPYRQIMTKMRRGHEAVIRVRKKRPFLKPT